MLEKRHELCDYGHRKPEALGARAAGAGGARPLAWQALLASQASPRVALAARVPTAVAIKRQRQALAALEGAPHAHAEEEPYGSESLSQERSAGKDRGTTRTRHSGGQEWGMWTVIRV